MSRHRSGRRAGRAHPGGPLPPARAQPADSRSRRVWPWIAAFAIVLAALAGWRARHLRFRLEPQADARAIYDEAVRLTRQGRFHASLPGFRAAAARPTGLWFVHHDCGSALFNAAHEGRTQLGLERPMERSSVEQIALVQEGLRQIDLAERFARQPRDLARIRRTRAQLMKDWGFPWDAFTALRASEWADSTWKESAGLADDYMDLMEHPTRPRARAPAARRP